MRVSIRSVGLLVAGVASVALAIAVLAGGLPISATAPKLVAALFFVALALVSFSMAGLWRRNAE